MQFPDGSVVGEKLIVLSPNSENNLFLFNFNRWFLSAKHHDRLPRLAPQKPKSPGTNLPTRA
jgi:hypothetical protein